MRISTVAVTVITAAIVSPSVAHNPRSEGPAASSVAAPVIRDCSSISAANRDLAPLSAVCESIKTMHRTLPNFVCEQTTQRYVPIASRIRGSEERRADDAVADVIRATVTYESGINRYTEIKVDDKSVDGEMFDIPGATSMGEFGSQLLSVFLSESAATFEPRVGANSVAGEEHVFGFRITAANNHSWTLREGRLGTHPALEGELWVRKDTNTVVRLNIFANIIDRAFAAGQVRVSTTFGHVQFGDAGTFLLPVESEAKLCTRDGTCMHNVTQWKGCRRFAAKARIIPVSE